MRTGRQRRVHRGFTMAEMVVAIAVTAVVLLAAQSAVMMASRAVPDAASPMEVRSRGADGMQRMMAELATAKTLIDASIDRVKFTVADRDADGRDEEIEYSWGGKAGDPVVRTAGDSSSEEVIPGVRAFTMVYDTSTEQDPTALVTGAETQLASYTAILPLGSSTVTFANCVAQEFTPSLPAGAVSFTVTRATLPLRSSGATTGTVLVRLRTAWNNQPTTTVVDGTALLESSLSSSFQPVMVSFSGGVALQPGTPLALVVQTGAGSPACDVQSVSIAVALGGQTMLTSSDGGQSWSTAALKQIGFTLYGKVTTLDTNQTIDRCLNARCTITAGTGPVAALHANAQMLNRPVMP